MLSPKKVKFRKRQKGRVTGKAQRGNSVAFGDFGLQAVGPARITARQIEALVELLKLDKQKLPPSAKK
jgi:large subunit ribosomal protein L16